MRLSKIFSTELAAAPIDGYGAGTRVVTGSGHPTAGMVYKLVEIDGRPVAKKSASKKSVGGKKTPYRVASGAEYFSLDGTVAGVPMYETVVDAGEVVTERSLEKVRQYTLHVLEGLEENVKLVEEGKPSFVSELATVQEDNV